MLAEEDRSAGWQWLYSVILRPTLYKLPTSSSMCCSDEAPGGLGTAAAAGATATQGTEGARLQHFASAQDGCMARQSMLNYPGWASRPIRAGQRLPLCCASGGTRARHTRYTLPALPKLTWRLAGLHAHFHGVYGVDGGLRCCSGNSAGHHIRGWLVIGSRCCFNCAVCLAMLGGSL